MLGTIGPNANQIHMHVQGYSSTQLQCFVRFLLKVVRACLGCSKLHYQPTRRGNFPNPNLLNLVLEVLRLHVDTVGADDADGAVHVRLAVELGETTRLHQEVHHVHLCLRHDIYQV